MTDDEEQRFARAFGDHLRRLREDQGRSRRALAERSGLSPDGIRRIERGALSPSLATLTKLCAGLGIAPSGVFARFELDERDELRELIATRPERDQALADRLLRVLFDDLDARKR